MPPTTSKATCPNCQAPIPAGSRQCVLCKLEVSKMTGFAAAKKAAERRGIKATVVGEIPAWRNAENIVRMVKLVVWVAVIGGIVWLGINRYQHFFGPEPPRYPKYPPTAEAAATEFLTHVCGGDATYDQAYFLIADSVRNPKARDERGDYVQVFHLLNRYLTTEFGEEWIKRTTLAPDPADPNTMVATVSKLEILHIRVAQQTPADKINSQGAHFGILGIQEMDVNDVADMRKNALISDAVHAVGPGAERDWSILAGATVGNRRMPPFMRKIVLLQALRDPQTTNWKTVLQCYPIRKDPVVRAHLTTMLNDTLYDPGAREKAKNVLDDKVDETDLVAAQVAD